MTISHGTREPTCRWVATGSKRTVTSRYGYTTGFSSLLRTAVYVCMAIAHGEYVRVLYAWHSELENPGAGAPGSGQETLTGTEAERYLLMLCDGYEANRDKFQYYICRGEVRWGRLKVSLSHPDVEKLLATDDGLLDAARQGLVVFSSRNCLEGTGFLLEFLDIRSRNIWRFRWTNTAEKPGDPVLPRAGAAQGPHYCNGNVDVLADDKYFIVAGRRALPPYMGEVSKQPSFVGVYSPWHESAWRSMSAMDTLRGYLQIVLPDPTKKAVLTVTKNVRKLGFMTTQVRFTMPGREETWWVCEDKGYIPVLVTVDSTENNYRSWRICDDIRRVDRRGWWPMHVAHWSSDSWSGIELRVHEVEAGRRPTRDMLTLTLAETPISVMYDPLRPMYIQGTMRVTVDDIPRLLARYYGRPEPSKSWPLWRYVTLAVTAIIVVVSGCGYAYVRLRRRKRSH